MDVSPIQYGLQFDLFNLTINHNNKPIKMTSDLKQTVFIQDHLSHNTVLSSKTFGYKVKLTFG